MKSLFTLLSFSFFLFSANSARSAEDYEVECEVKGDPDERILRLEEVKVGKDMVWAVSVNSKKTDNGENREWVQLELIGKKPKLGRDSLDLKYQSGLGAEVAWLLNGETKSFKANIIYELEVNETRYKIPLDSRVVEMNSDKPWTNLDCKFKK